tara:strand:+ start:82 stop:1203 length:1122 start_codon:yes stop_codon:yes gene_type:complete
MASKKQKTCTMPDSLAKLAAAQVFTAHGEVAEKVIDGLWADPIIRKTIEARVMAKARTNTAACHYDLDMATDYVAIMGIEKGNEVSMQNVLVPVMKLPRWLRVFLGYWVNNMLRQERENPASITRCGFGGLWLHLDNLATVLSTFDILIARHPVDMLASMFWAFKIDPRDHFHDELVASSEEVMARERCVLEAKLELESATKTLIRLKNGYTIADDSEEEDETVDIAGEDHEAAYEFYIENGNDVKRLRERYPRCAARWYGPEPTHADIGRQHALVGEKHEAVHQATIGYETTKKNTKPVEDVDPLQKWAKEAKDFIRTHLKFSDLLWDKDEKIDFREWLERLEAEMAGVNMTKCVLPAPVVTLVVSYDEWEE